MHITYISVKSKIRISLPAPLVDKLPEKIVIFTTIQFLHNLESIIKKLKQAGKKPILVQPKHTAYKGQILGCSIETINLDFDAFLYIGDGMFHPQALVLKNDKPVFIYNPFSKKQSVISSKEIDKIRKKKKGALLKFHTSKNIGVLITTKPGQNRLISSLSLESKFPEKNFFFYILNTLNPTELENFPYIDIFINTMCPRIAYDDYEKLPKPVINLEDLGISW